jgi:retron-type reverse transcriptase
MIPKRGLLWPCLLRIGLFNGHYQKINPYFTKGYIADSFACIKGRGAHQAVQRLIMAKTVGRKPCKYYYLKLDISKYYYRIDHDVLVEILSRKIKDTKLMKLLEGIIRCEDHSFVSLSMQALRKQM